MVLRLYSLNQSWPADAKEMTLTNNTLPVLHAPQRREQAEAVSTTLQELCISDAGEDGTGVMA